MHDQRKKDNHTAAYRMFHFTSNKLAINYDTYSTKHSNTAYLLNANLGSSQITLGNQRSVGY